MRIEAKITSDLSGDIAALIEGKLREVRNEAATKLVANLQHAITYYKAIDTGFMKQNIDIVEGVGAIGGDSVAVHVRAPYAGYIALGTKRMPARPFHTMAIDMTRRQMGGSVA